MARGAMDFGATQYGGARFSTMTGDEAGYGTESGEVMLHSLALPPEALALIQDGKAVRILSDGTCEAIDGERAGLIVFGRSKADRPRLGGR